MADEIGMPVGKDFKRFVLKMSDVKEGTACPCECITEHGDKCRMERKYVTITVDSCYDDINLLELIVDLIDERRFAKVRRISVNDMLCDWNEELKAVRIVNSLEQAIDRTD